MPVEHETNVKGGKKKRILIRILLAVLLLFVALDVSEHIISARGADNFYTLASIPVGESTHKNDGLYGNENYAIAKNYRGKQIFKNPSAAFEKMKKASSPLIKAIQSKYDLPPFSPSTYHQYVQKLGNPPGYFIPGYNKISSLHLASDLSSLSGIYENSTQLLFTYEKNLWEESG